MNKKIELNWIEKVVENMSASIYLAHYNLQKAAKI